MTVYCVFECGPGEYNLLGLFSTREKADAFIAHHWAAFVAGHPDWKYDSESDRKLDPADTAGYEVEEFTLDEPPDWAR